MAEIGQRAWVGVDVGKTAHHLEAVDVEGRTLARRRVDNDQAAIEAAIGEVTATAEQVIWAVDMTSSSAALLLGLLIAAGQRVVYVPGRTVNRMAGAFRGEAKTDAKDARVIAETARMRRDFLPAAPPEELVAELSLLLGHRRELGTGWVRGINRIRDLLTGIFPALERAFDFSTRSALILVARYQTPAALRKAGRKRVETYLRRAGARNTGQVADKALAAADAQTVVLPGQDTAAGLIAGLAADLLDLDRRIKDTDKAIAAKFGKHPQAGIIQSLPGMGTQLGAEFVVATGDLSTFAGPDQIAAYAGLAPVPRDSGRVTGNLHKPKRYNRALRMVFYMSALSSINTPGPSRDYYNKKRAEGKPHQQALMALARRRIDVLWALLRENRHFQLQPPATCATAA